jgi:GT2 family glycosyltransferase
MLPIRLICATRYSETQFHQTSALGRSLRIAYGDVPGLELTVFPDGNPGLPAVYNIAIRAAAQKPAILLFIHDDVHLLDIFWPDRLHTALELFQIVGLAGNRRRAPRQPAWAFKDEWFTPEDRDNLSGLIAHGTTFPCPIRRLGRLGPCKLLDGVFLAVRSDALLDNDLYFDERFDFTCWDLDFCRQAEAKGITMGTAPIGVMHESIGKFRTAEWATSFQRYLEKWGGT